MSIYRYTLVIDLCGSYSSFSRKKVMDAYRKEQDKWKNHEGYELLNNKAFHFFLGTRWRVVQVIADKLI